MSTVHIPVIVRVRGNLSGGTGEVRNKWNEVIEPASGPCIDDMDISVYIGGQVYILDTDHLPSGLEDALHDAAIKTLESERPVDDL